MTGLPGFVVVVIVVFFKTFSVLQLGNGLGRKRIRKNSAR